MARRLRFRVWSVRAVALSLAVGLLAVAVPYAWSAAILLPTRAPLAQFNTTTPRETLNAVAAKQNQAATIFMTGSDAAALGSTGFLLREKSMLVESLRAHPADAKNWARLASLRYDIADPASAMAYYDHSLALGRYLPGFMNWRLMLGISLWPHMPETLRQQTAEQAYILWHKPSHRKEFLRLARTGTVGPALKNMLETYHPEEMAEFMRRWQPPKFMKPKIIKKTP